MIELAVAMGTLVDVTSVSLVVHLDGVSAIENGGLGRAE